MKQLILLFSAFLLIAGFTFPTKNTSNTVSKKNKGYQVGDVAADFNLKNIDDKMVSLESIKGAKGYIVVFTCNSRCCITKIRCAKSLVICRKCRLKSIKTSHYAFP